eukprot:SAG31_NODE_23708_length_498_cov_0.784461_1_plen_63_part_10
MQAMIAGFCIAGMRFAGISTVPVGFISSWRVENALHEVDLLNHGGCKRVQYRRYHTLFSSVPS